MKKEYQEKFFKLTEDESDLSELSIEDIEADTIKNLREIRNVSGETKNIIEQTTYGVYQQDLKMVEGKKDLIRMNKPIKQADEALTDMAGCGWRCTIS